MRNEKNGCAESWGCVILKNIQDPISPLKADKPLCIHLPEMPKCCCSRYEVKNPVVASDGYIYDKLALDRYLKSSNISPKTGEILKNEYQEVRLLVANQRRSKLDPRQYFDSRNSIVLVCRNRNRDESATLMIETSNSEGRASILAYQFQGNNLNDDVTITSEEITDLNYSKSTTLSLLSQYGVDEPQAQGRAFVCTSEVITKLEKLISEDRDLANKKILRYCYRAGKGFYLLKDLIFSEIRHNACTWIRNVLHRAEILETARINFDREWGLLINPATDFIMGAIPDRVLPLPAMKR